MILKEKSKMNEQECNSQILINKNKDKLRINLVGRLGTKIDYLKAITKNKFRILNKEKISTPKGGKNIIADDEF